MKTLWMYISYFLYYNIGYYLPSSTSRLFGFCKNIRAWLAKGFITYGGSNINIQSRATISRRISIGDYSGIGKYSQIQGGVKIGKHVMMGPEVFIYTQNHNHTSIQTTMDQQGFEKERPLTIEDDVWIGSRVTILPGVTIGKGSILGASAVITKNVPPYSIVAGNPAKVVRSRI